MIRFVVRAICLGVVCAMPAAYAAEAEDVCSVRSADFLQAWQKGDNAAAAAHFDAQVKAAMSAQRLDQLWSHKLPEKFGAFDHAAAMQMERKGDMTVVDTPLHFARGWVRMRVACDASDQIAGLFFAPGQDPAAAALAAPLPPGAHERPLAVSTPLGPLPGTLTLPAGKGPFPAVLLVVGSGPHDRDATIGPNKSFRDLAMGLAAAGIASLRYDKRTLVYGAQMTGKAITVDDEVTDDAVTAAHLLARQPGIDPRRVFVLGHSLGATMAPRIGQRDPQLAGLILMAAAARPALDVIAEQVREQIGAHALTPAQVAAGEKAIEAERQLLAKADPRHPPQGSYGGVPQSYWLSMQTYQPVAVAQTLSMPLLILQGGSDFQVSPTNDFARWQRAFAGRPQVTLDLYQGLNHLFMPAGKTGTVADYDVPAHVDARVIRDVARWVLAQPPRG